MLLSLLEKQRKNKKEYEPTYKSQRLVSSNLEPSA